MFESGPVSGLAPRNDSDIRMFAVFPQLTDKQHEVLHFVAENRTSKEIAWSLGISESAVNQRIESVRNRTGFPPRAELARTYRHYQQDIEAACKPFTGQIPQVPGEGVAGHPSLQDDAADSLVLADAMTFSINAPWQDASRYRVVPEVLDGANAGLNRTVAMIAIAGGLLVVAMVGLGVAQALTAVF
jgi:DNA-binding CsgD family transcriptional regulator